MTFLSSVLMTDQLTHQERSYPNGSYETLEFELLTRIMEAFPLRETLE